MRSIPAQHLDDTRHQLVRAAERLFAERGLDGVSLREIVREAGARNTGAVHYHFGDRRGLVTAILDRHAVDVDARRHALLDDAEVSRPLVLRDLAGALVRPLAAKLGEPDGGRDFLRIEGHLYSRPDFRFEESSSHPGDSLQRWRRLVAKVMDPGAVRLHRRFSAITLTTAELARRAEGRPRRDDRLFVANLVDLVTGVLASPLSDETTRLASERSRRI